MLLQSKCEDIAIHLSKACLNTYTSFNEDLEGFDTLDFTQDEIDYITDIYFSSLLKTKKKTELITEVSIYVWKIHSSKKTVTIKILNISWFCLSAITFSIHKLFLFSKPA